MAELASVSPTGPAPQTTQKLNFYREVARLQWTDLEYQLLQVLLRELRGTPDEQRKAAQRRFRAWLDLPLTDGATIAAAYESAVQQLTPEQQAELDLAERDAVLNGLRYREFERLAEFVPWLRAWNVASPRERQVSLPPLLAASLALATAA